MTPYLVLGGVIAVGAAVAGAGFGGYRHGLKVARADCAAERLEARDAAEVQAEAQRLAGRAADAQFARWRASQESRRVRASTDLRKALSGPISCAGGALADVRVPAAAVDSLRRAGADELQGPGSAASGAGR